MRINFKNIFRETLDYQDFDAKIKNIDLGIKTPTRGIGLSIGIFLEEIKRVVEEKLEFQFREKSGKKFDFEVFQF